MKSFVFAATIVLLAVGIGTLHAGRSGVKLGISGGVPEPHSVVPSNGTTTAPAVASPYTDRGRPFITTDHGKSLFGLPDVAWVCAGSKEEFLAGRIPGALFLPPEEFEGGAYPALLQAMAREHSIVVYCESGCSSAEYVAQRIIEFGFEKTLVLAEGFVSWKSRGLPVEGQ